MARPSSQEALAQDAMKALAYGWSPLSGGAEEALYSMLAYKAPRDNVSLQLATQLQSALSAVCRAASSETVALNPSLVERNVNLARSRLRELKSIWGCVVDKVGVSDDESQAAKNHVRRLFAVHHRCLPLLLAAHAWALRTSSPCRDNQISDIGLLLMDLQFAIRVVSAAEPVAPVDAPLLRTWEAVAVAFLRTQPLHATSAVLDAHRQQLAACRGDPVAELAALRQAANAWTGAVDLAAFFSNSNLAWGEAAKSIIPSDFGSSHILQHLCALRLDLAEGLARAGHGEGEAAGGGATAAAEGAKQMVQQLEGKDVALLKAIASATYQAPRTGEWHVHIEDLSVSVELETREPRSSEVAMRSALSHPAVQCLLGWWLVALGAAEGRGRAWGLPEPLLRHVGDMGERDKLCVQALKSAALCWDIELRLWQEPSPPQHSSDAAAAAAAAAAQGSEGEAAAVLAGCGSAAVPGMLPGAAAGTVLLASASVSAGAESGSMSHDLHHRPFPYSPLQMYRMCAAAFRTCCCLAENVHLPTRFDDCTLVPAIDSGMGVLIGSLLRMPPAQAARRLASVWQLLLQCSKAGIEIYSSTLGLCMARLLGELPPRLQQQQHGDENEGVQQQLLQGQEEGEVQQRQQHNRQETRAGGGAPETGGEVAGSGATAGCPSSDHGEGAAAPGLTSRPPSNHEGGRGTSVPHVVSCALEAGLLPALEASIRDHVRRYEQHTVYEFTHGAELVDLALRRPGCWPALLAHSDPRQAAALVVSLGKAARAEEAAERKEAAVRGRPQLSSNSLLQLQLLALLEQLGPRPCGAGGDGDWGGTVGAAAASGSEGSAGGGGAGAGGRWPDLRLNRRLGGVGREEEEREGEAGAGCADAASGSSSSRAGSKEGSSSSGGGSGSSSGRSTTPAWAAGPTWQQVAAAGGCPAPGTPPQLQLARLSVLAATEWLPVLLTRPPYPAAAAARAPRVAAEVGDLPTLRAYRVAWAWLRLVARQALAFGQDGSCAVHAGWVSFLMDRLQAIGQARPVITLSNLDAGIGGRGLLPAALDVLEVAALVVPDRLREALVEKQAGTHGCIIAWASEVFEAIQGQPGREPLAAAVRALAAEVWTGGPGACIGPVWDELRRAVRLRVCREGLPLLPGPHVHGDVGLPRCANAWCARAEGPSEARVRLQACGRCRAVGYCSADCQRADWAAGHKAACGRAGAGGAQ